ncbi:DUF2779 domain-containing protein [Flavobacteriaceae bacterium]|nr:DUF2779 domain-containing protein [Flavobacteriaceae bacterium]MDC0858122.1 DUF2779 domain-containing protein [Flavobacteriaceae bacterium]
MTNSKLSKSTFIRGLQCEKSLYLYKHHYRLKDPKPSSLQAVFDQGTNIGLLAQELFPNGADASPENHFKMVESVGKTLDFISQGESIIYEATFQYNNVLAALDILVKVEEGWKAFEVKSSTKVSDTYIKDAAIQYYTITNSGIDLKDISIVHINNQYTKEGALAIHQLFTIESVYDQVLEFLPRIPNEVRRLKNIIESHEVPNVDIGNHCSAPYDCDFKGTCWKHIPDYSVFNISRLNKDKKFDLYNQGVITLDQIDLSKVSLNPNQVLQVQSEVNGTTHIDIDEIRNFTNGLSYPLYFLDFETIGPAVPKYNVSRPYQQLVFQYSLHIQETLTSKLEHREYLADPSQDPRIKFIEQLIKDCSTSGDIVVYNIGFERGKLNDLMEVFPQYSNELGRIVNRMKDLMIPFQQKWYYTPEMKGSYSIKYVLPALVPKLSYSDLEIKEGGTASNTFLSMVNGTFKGDIKETRMQLLEYCKLDTYAMVKILEVLLSI